MIGALQTSFTTWKWIVACHSLLSNSFWEYALLYCIWPFSWLFGWWPIILQLNFIHSYLLKCFHFIILLWSMNFISFYKNRNIKNIFKEINFLYTFFFFWISLQTMYCKLLKEKKSLYWLTLQTCSKRKMIAFQSLRKKSTVGRSRCVQSPQKRLPYKFNDDY